MTFDQITAAVEDLLESSIPLNEYHLTVDRENGGASLTICRCDHNSIPHMYALSEIFNSYSTDWRVAVDQNRIKLIVK